jgi:hypothetical protein
MKEMLLNTQHNRSESNTNLIPHQPSRSHQGEEDDDRYEKRLEKRVNRRQTPTKKLIFEEEHISEDLMTQYESLNHKDDNASSATDERC